MLEDEYLRSELDDGVAAIEWIARQPWCDGSVGMMGISWGGFNSLQIAALRPRPLKAIVTLCSTDDRYADDTVVASEDGIEIFRRESHEEVLRDLV